MASHLRTRPHVVLLPLDPDRVSCKRCFRAFTQSPCIALISGRTADNPRLLKEVIAAGCTHVYLEKPGAPSVPELEEMIKYAKEKGVPVYMGYNKNVTPYVLKALEYQKKNGGDTTFVHNNAYKEDELPECFERNAEGMLKNMVGRHARRARLHASASPPLLALCSHCRRRSMSSRYSPPTTA